MASYELRYIHYRERMVSLAIVFFFFLIIISFHYHLQKLRFWGETLLCEVSQLQITKKLLFFGCGCVKSKGFKPGIKGSSAGH